MINLLVNIFNFWTESWFKAQRYSKFTRIHIIVEIFVLVQPDFGKSGSVDGQGVHFGTQAPRYRMGCAISIDVTHLKESQINYYDFEMYWFFILSNGIQSSFCVWFNLKQDKALVNSNSLKMYFLLNCDSVTFCRWGLNCKPLFLDHKALKIS